MKTQRCRGGALMGRLATQTQQWHTFNHFLLAVNARRQVSLYHRFGKRRHVLCHVATPRHVSLLTDAVDDFSSQSDVAATPNLSSSSKKRKLAEDIEQSCKEDGNFKIRPELPLEHSSSRGPRFACPYFKHQPSKYQRWSICPGPGWQDVHRVKTHLYRRHRQPKYWCERCWTPFKDEQCRRDHSRMNPPCDLEERRSVEGFDSRQETRLKSRKATRGLGEIEKWQAMYRILFPDVKDAAIPSPFHDEPSQARRPTQASLIEVEEFVLREVPLRLGQAFHPQAAGNLTVTELRLSQRAIERCKPLLADVFREFRQRHRASSASRPEPIEYGPDCEAGSSQGDSVAPDTVEEESPDVHVGHLASRGFGVDFGLAEYGNLVSPEWNFASMGGLLETWPDEGPC
ncbi:hypothetical protein F4780DRAFT_450220 [Xylariomycetidae sp. FL0641]|nr:hypothetical protein F4780DRAFT_450220 [Xylariomycetidae sp. FL0641]